MNKQQKAGLGVGGSSLLMVFIIVCLTTFATLSLVSASADDKLSIKTAEAVSAYYDADGRAVERVQTIDVLLSSGQAEQIRARDLAEEMDGGYTFTETMNDRQTLQVALTVQNGRCVITSWRVVNTGQWSGDEQLLNIWDGQ